MPWSERPEVLFARAAALEVSDDHAAASALLARAEIVAGPQDEDGRVALSGALSVLLIGDEQRSRGEACDRLHRLLASVPDIPPASYGAAMFVLGWSEMRLRRSLEQIAEPLRAAVRACESTGQVSLARRATLHLAFALSWAGDLDEAERILGEDRERLELSGAWRSFDGGLEEMTRLYIAYWRDDPATAEIHGARLVSVQGPQTAHGALARVFRSIAACASGDLDRIDETARDLAQVSAVERHGVPWDVYTTVAKMLVLESRGRLAAANRLAEEISLSLNVPVMTGIVMDFLRRHGHLAQAERLQQRLRGPGVPRYTKVSALITAAVVHRVRGQREAAHRALEQALDLACERRLLRPLNLADPYLRSLLGEHASWGSRHQEFIARHLGSAEGPDSTAAGDLIEPLSRRERQILAYLRTTMTTAEIAAALHVSINTVKTHQRAIYRKLDVNSRREAIARRV